MADEFNLGRLSAGGATAAGLKKSRMFRLAVLGDFSARASRGERESGDALARRKALKVEADTVDTLLARLSPKLQLTLPGSGTVELEFACMEDFHPDALYEKLGIFSDLAGLRQRLKSSGTFDKAAAELRAIGLKAPPEPLTVPVVARGTVIDADATLDDFLRSVDGTAGNAAEVDPKTSLDAFLHGVVAPYITASKNPQQEQFVAVADEAISAMMREVLHHPDFQALESAWRSLAFLASRLDTDETLQVVMLDLSAEEFAADLAADAAALQRLLVEQPAEDERTGPFSAVVGNYVFERTPAHADLLGRVARVVAQAPAPFIASVPGHALDGDPEELPIPIRDAWEALRALPEAAYLALGLPRFMLRLPYGKKTDPVESFKFEEFTPHVGLKAMLWANPAVAVGLLLAQTFRREGDKMRPGALTGIEEMPYYTYTDADGDQTALPCTERFITASVQESILSQGFLPLLAVKNSPEVRVGGFRAVGGAGLLAGWWAPVSTSSPGRNTAPAAIAPEPAIDFAETSAPAETEATDAPAETETEAAAPAETAEETPAAATDSAAPADASTGDPELDALLAGLASDTPPPPTEAEQGIDPDLAALLAELGD